MIPDYNRYVSREKFSSEEEQIISRYEDTDGMFLCAIQPENRKQQQQQQSNLLF